MKTSELLRAVCAELDNHKARHFFLCQIAEDLSGAEGRMRLESALRAAGWDRAEHRVAFYPTDEAPAYLRFSYIGDLCQTARIVWCLWTARKYEARGD